MKKTVLHYNKPQITTMLVKANKTIAIMSRGVGKSTGLVSPHSIYLANELPGGSTGIVGATFQQLLVRTLPPVISNWERMGYKRDIHFSIGKPFPKSWNVPQPIVKPLSTQNTIFWFNGHIDILVSQDRPGSSNGLSLNALIGDEAKLLNKTKLDEELMPTLRGLRHIFGKSPAYRSEFWTSDMPTSEKGKWLLEKVEHMDVELIDLIIQLQVSLNSMWLKVYQSNNDSRVLRVYQPKINKLTVQLNKLRSKATHYIEANVFDNIDVLGMDYVNDMKRNMSDLSFRSAILNERLKKVESGFYSFLNEDKHGYDSYDYNYLDDLQYDFDKLKKQDSRHDGDLNRKQPLDIAMDYGSSINLIVVGQPNDDEYNIVNALHVLHPQLVKHAVEKFCDYYKHYPTKIVNYYYDHTAIGGIGTTDYTYQSQVIETFKKNGWDVVTIYIGQAPPHDRKYEFWGTLLQEHNTNLPRFRYNKTNCKYLELSMLQAKVKQGRKGFEKDKSSERPDSKGNYKMPPEESTHYSDGVDTLMFGQFISKLEKSSIFIPSSI